MADLDDEKRDAESIADDAALVPAPSSSVPGAGRDRRRDRGHAPDVGKAPTWRWRRDALEAPAASG
jgi:hypothetical protein